jgi:hypothetical protein
VCDRFLRCVAVAGEGAGGGGAGGSARTEGEGGCTREECCSQGSVVEGWEVAPSCAVWASEVGRVQAHGRECQLSLRVALGRDARLVSKAGVRTRVSVRGKGACVVVAMNSSSTVVATPSTTESEKALTKPTVLVAEKLGAAGIDLLEKVAVVDCSYNLSNEDLCSKISQCDALIVRSETKVTREVFEAFKGRLNVVGRAAAGASQPGVLLPDDVAEVAPKALEALIVEDEAAEGAPRVKETEGPSALGEDAAAEMTKSLGDATAKTAASAKDTASDVVGAVEDKASEAGDVTSAKAGEVGSYVNESASQAEDLKKKASGEAKVAKLGFVALVEEDVVGFEVAVHDGAAEGFVVKVGEPLDDAEEDVVAFRPGEGENEEQQSVGQVRAF